MEVRHVEAGQGQDHERRQRHQLDDHQNEIDCRAFAGADQEHSRHQQGDEDRRQVDKSARPGAGRRQQGVGDRDMCAMDQPAGIARPAHRNGAADQGVFQDQAPPDHPGDQLAQGHVGIGIGAARLRAQAGHLGVAERREGADRARHREAQDHGRPGQAGSDSGQGIDACADDGAHAKGDEMVPGQRPFQPVAVGRRSAGLDSLAARNKAHAIPLLSQPAHNGPPSRGSPSAVCAPP